MLSLALMLQILPTLATWQPPVAPYLGPDTMLPLASILAAGLGVVLMFGRRVIGGLRRLARGGQPADLDDAEAAPDLTSAGSSEQP